MPVIVHHWPYTGIGEGQNVGHAAVQVVGPNECYISWWPGSDRTSKIPGEQKMPNSVRRFTGYLYSAPANRNQTYQTDETWEGAPSTRIEVVGLDEAAIKVWWDGFRRSPPLWSALNVNCAMVAAYALRAGGAEDKLKGMSGWWRSWNTVWSPNDVKRLAEEINRNST